MHPYFGDGRRLLIAHRGGSKRWPENTLLSFEHAYDLGYRWIETDVQLTRDGEIVIFHDTTLERTTNGQGAVSDHTLAELKPLDAGHGFTPDGRSFPRRDTGVQIPTLLEALECWPALHLNIEMKTTDPNLPEALWSLIERRGAHERVLVASAHDALTRRFRKLANRRVPTSAGRDGILQFWLAVQAGGVRFMRPEFDALQVPIQQGCLRVVDQRFVDAAHRHGLLVHVWTVDDAREMQWLDRIGVDGIMTDRPEVLWHTLGE